MPFDIVERAESFSFHTPYAALPRHMSAQLIKELKAAREEIERLRRTACICTFDNHGFDSGCPLHDTAVHHHESQAMTELRTRLAEVLREHFASEVKWQCGGCDWEGSSTGDDPWADHIADVLLSLPGIAIVDTSRVDLHEARRLYKAAARDWEFHDASLVFHQFMSWIEDNFSALLPVLKATKR